MATKGKPQDTRWLAGWKDMQGTENTALTPFDEPTGIHDNLVSLTQLGYLVRIAGTCGNYQITCLAMRDTPYRLKEPVGLSYCGASIADVLAAAAYEADLLATSPTSAEYRIGERARWVQS